MSSYSRKINENNSQPPIFEYIYEEIENLRGVSKELGFNGTAEKEKMPRETYMSTVCQKEPVAGESCSLTTEEGRKKCLETEAVRWEAYRAAMSVYGTPRTPVKRKISDYFQKMEK